MNQVARFVAGNGLDDVAAGGRLMVDLGALAANYRTLCDLSAPTPVAAVVKADAYGLGASRIVPVLYSAGCRDFFVAHLVEAVRLRPHIAGDARLFVLNGLMPGSEGVCADIGAIPVLNSLDQIRNWSDVASARGCVLPAALQVDTGMTRLGLSPAELAELATRTEWVAGLEIALLMSHLACADEAEHEANPSQLERMRAAHALFPDLPLSFANSGGILLGSDYRGDLARPGVALYGAAPAMGIPNPMQPVIRVDLRVIQTRTVPAGTAVGYGGSCVTQRETRIATLAAGYADGLPRSASHAGAVYMDGVRLPILGRVSMDSVMVDVSALQNDALSAGSLVEWIGPHQTLEQVAADAGTISYEILTRLGQRYHRHYHYPEGRILGSGQGRP